MSPSSAFCLAELKPHLPLGLLSTTSPWRCAKGTCDCAVESNYWEHLVLSQTHSARLLLLQARAHLKTAAATHPSLWLAQEQRRWDQVSMKSL